MAYESMGLSRLSSLSGLSRPNPPFIPLYKRGKEGDFSEQ
jgi:hypothetical protein